MKFEKILENLSSSVFYNLIDPYYALPEFGTFLNDDRFQRPFESAPLPVAEPVSSFKPLQFEPIKPLIPSKPLSLEPIKDFEEQLFNPYEPIKPFIHFEPSDFWHVDDPNKQFIPSKPLIPSNPLDSTIFPGIKDYPWEKPFFHSTPLSEDPVLGYKPFSCPIKENPLSIVDFHESGVQLHIHEEEGGIAHFKHQKIGYDSNERDYTEINSFDAAMADLRAERLGFNRIKKY